MSMYLQRCRFLSYMYSFQLAVEEGRMSNVKKPVTPANGSLTYLQRPQPTINGLYSENSFVSHQFRCTNYVIDKVFTARVRGDFC